MFIKMKNSVLRNAIIAGIFAAIATTTVSARTSDAIGPGDSYSQWVVGGYAGAISNPYAGEDSVAFIVPNIEYRGEKFFVEDGAVGYNLFRQADVSVGLIMTPNVPFLVDHEEYDDNEKLEGLKERDATVDAGIYVQHTTPMGRLRVTVLDEVTGEHVGQSADINYTFDFNVDRLNINPVIGVAWTDAAANNHFFGVSAGEATVERDAYEASDAASFYTGVRGRYELTPHWDLSAGVSYVKLGDGIAESSIIDQDEVYVGAIGSSYNF